MILEVYKEIGVFNGVMTMLFWWGLFFLLLRLRRRKSEGTYWRIDLGLTLIQSIVVTLLFPLIIEWLTK